MKNWIIALAVLVIPVLTYFVLDKVQPVSSFEAQANTGKPAVIKFHSTMCLDCKKLDTVTKEVMPLYADKVSYQSINAQNTKGDKATEALVEKYNVNLVPTMVFLNKDGSVYKRTEGYITKNQLIHILDGLVK